MSEVDLYVKGDAARYTGRSEILHGGLFYEIEMLEGHEKGALKWVSYRTKTVAEQARNAATR